MNARPTAMVLAPSLAARGGAERLALACATVLRNAGYDTTIASPDPEPGILGSVGTYFALDLSEVRHLDITVARTGIKARLPERIRELQETHARTRLLRSNGKPTVFIDSVYRSQQPGIGYFNLRYVHFPAPLKPVVGGLRHAYVSMTDVFGRFLLNGGKSFPHTYDRVVANSQYTSRHVQQRWGVPCDVLYPPCTSKPSSTRDRKPWILSVGRFEDPRPHLPYKNQDAIIKAFADLEQLHHNGWELHLAGSASSEATVDRLRRMASGLPVVLHPSAAQADLDELYQTSSVYCHAQGYGEDEQLYPEAHEHFGISVVEALSAGLIPAVHASGGPREIVQMLGSEFMWTSLDSLKETLSRVTCLTRDEQVAIRRRAISRASDFSPRHFEQHLLELIPGA